MRWIAIAIVLLLAGCGFTQAGDAFRVAVKEGGEKAMREGLVNTEWFLCRAASVGAVIDRYGRSEETATAWRAICRDNPEAVIVKPAN